ncbi:2-dehydro-3-deoxygalactonokinase [Aurantimonas sp. A2-1-M11]|uniref:2-dehydro-3-deoxygalactonokinase n=1 Tax=Aurantimonas sp. A2-1-M11 TaxID=3113712 RepID=UPI002F953CCC
MNAYCAAVDWGTTSFRLWLLDETGRILAERRSGEGMVSAGPDGFAAILEAHLTAVGADANLPVIACGMVGARQGWVEAPYVDTPATTASIAASACRVPGLDRPVHILPGVAQRTAGQPDVMRGEETQILGLPDRAGGRDDPDLVCLPGTHSKWVALENGRISGFATFITGDLFAALAKHTILRHSVADPAAPFDRQSFAEGFRAGLDNPAEATSQMFAIRAGGLLDAARGGDGGSRLSGLVLGLEFAGGRSRFGATPTLTLVASGHLLDIYSAACELAGIEAVAADADAAVRRGLFAAAREILA